MNFGCKCGAVTATPAAYRQMTFAERNAFQRQAANCETCKRDREAAKRRER